MAIRGVIFDFNGTLFWDTDKQNAAWRIWTQRHAGKGISDEFFLSMHGRPNQAWFGILLGYEPDSMEEVIALSEEKEDVYRELCLADPARFHLAPGAEELFGLLTERHIPHGIATSADEKNIRFYFEHFDLGRWFERRHVVFNDRVRPGKPAPDIYLDAAKALGLEPRECAVVEDMATGVLSAHAAGAGCIIGIRSDGSHALDGNPCVNLLIDDFHHAEKWLDMIEV